MDVRMPEMDGYEAIRRIRQFNKKIFIIAQTAHALTGDREKALAAGANDYISKPVRKDKLLKLIQTHFKK
jgi:CheY-like chemotaxis protein